MSAEIIPFILRPKHIRAPAAVPRLVIHSTARPDDLTVDHADTSPCEYVRADHGEIRIEDG